MSLAVYYLGLLPAIREAARTRGYAVALHGSLERDLDLIAVPWTKDADHPEALAEAVRLAVDGHWHPSEEGDTFHRQGCPGLKPHGRLVWSIQLGDGAYIDLSVMPRQEAK